MRNFLLFLATLTLASSLFAQAAAPAKKELTNAAGMKLALIPAGEFTMGAPKTEPGQEQDEILHKVKISQPFYMGAMDVTRQQFAAFVQDAKYVTDAEKQIAAAKDPAKAPKGTWQKPGFDQTDADPVVWVSWNDAQAYCKWLSGKDMKKAYRLPTEAQWEYACRAGTQTPFNTGDKITTDQANFNGAAPSMYLKDAAGKPIQGENRKATTPGTKFPPNKWGLHDMHGNVWQWCQEGEAPYQAGDQTDPLGPDKGPRLLRGGDFTAPAHTCRAANRYRERQDGQRASVGFRVVTDAK